MDKDNFVKLLNQFESALSAAWSYDARLDCQDDYISSKQLTKSDELHQKYRDIRTQIMTEIEKIDVWTYL